MEMHTFCKGRFHSQHQIQSWIRQEDPFLVGHLAWGYSIGTSIPRFILLCQEQDGNNQIATWRNKVTYSNGVQSSEEISVN